MQGTAENIEKLKFMRFATVKDMFPDRPNISDCNALLNLSPEEETVSAVFWQCAKDDRPFEYELATQVNR